MPAPTRRTLASTTALLALFGSAGPVTGTAAAEADPGELPVTARPDERPATARGSAHQAGLIATFSTPSRWFENSS